MRKADPECVHCKGAGGYGGPAGHDVWLICDCTRGAVNRPALPAMRVALDPPAPVDDPRLSWWNPMAPIPKSPPSATLPRYETPGASGMDLRFVAWRRSEDGADVRRTDTMVLDPGERALCLTGMRIALPAGHEAQIRPRSGLSLRTGLDVVLGTVDADYRGEVGIIVRHLGTEQIKVLVGERIAQLVVAPVVRVALEVVASLDETARGDGGFGSTGRV